MPAFSPVNSVYSKFSSKWIQSKVVSWKFKKSKRLLKDIRMCIPCGYFEWRNIEKFTQIYVEYLSCRTIIFLIDIKNKINRLILFLLLTKSL